MKTYTEQELRMLQRIAFVAGADLASAPPNRTYAEWCEIAQNRYPNPVRPREVRGGDGFWYRLVDGRIQRKGMGDWHDTALGEQTLRVVADLLTNPTEPVED